MLSTIFSASPIVLLVIMLGRAIYLSRKKEPIVLNMSYGNICYSCKEDIHEEYNYDNKDNHTLCKSCKRDETLNNLTNNLFKYREKFLRFQGEHPIKLSWIMLGTMISLSILDGLIRHFTGISLKMGTIGNIIYILLSMYRIEMSFRTKKQI
jgi:hypothetical protein